MYSLGLKFNPHFLVISLGNPVKHYETLHSAGHFALQSLHKLLVTWGIDQPTKDHVDPVTGKDLGFKRAKRFHQKPSMGWVGHKYTLLQCPTEMNVSGLWVTKVWAQARRERRTAELEEHARADPQPRLGPDPHRSGLALIVLHDELEDAFGSVKKRDWRASHRGHNGVRSVQERNPYHQPHVKAWRISIGIGRPKSREHQDVASYVLSPLTDDQQRTLDTKTGSEIMAFIEGMEKSWKREHDLARAFKVSQLSRELQALELGKG